MTRRWQPRESQLSRRDLLKGAAFGAAALGLNGCVNTGRDGPATNGKGSGMVPIIDTHQHLWDLGKQELPWLKRAGALKRDFLLSDYMIASEGLGFARSIYMEVAVKPERAERDLEADLILDLCRKGTPFPCAAVLGGDPGAPDFRDYMSRFQSDKFVKGIRRIPGNKKPHPFLSREFVAGVRHLGGTRDEFRHLRATAASGDGRQTR